MVRLPVTTFMGSPQPFLFFFLLFSALLCFRFSFAPSSFFLILPVAPVASDTFFAPRQNITPLLAVFIRMLTFPGSVKGFSPFLIMSMMFAHPSRIWYMEYADCSIMYTPLAIAIIFFSFLDALNAFPAIFATPTASPTPGIAATALISAPDTSPLSSDTPALRRSGTAPSTGKQPAMSSTSCNPSSAVSHQSCNGTSSFWWLPCS